MSAKGATSEKGHGIEALPLRILPGADLRRRLEAAVGAGSAFVVSGIGSLANASLRFAGKDQPDLVEGDFEILTLAGSISPSGSHLHMSIAGAQGQVIGGHVSYGCTVRTTAEVLVLLLPEGSLTRALDPATGFMELVVRRGGAAPRE
jgi:uncharacterized protein